MLESLVEKPPWTPQHFPFESVLRFILPIEFHGAYPAPEAKLDSNVHLDCHLLEDGDTSQIEGDFHEFPKSEVFIVFELELSSC